MEASCLALDDPEELVQPQAIPVESDVSDPEDFDFVEPPSEDFFCPVTFELLLNPHQTTCCGNHLSEKAVSRLERDGKPCPMCKEPQLTTVRDKFHGRKASAVQVRCPNAPSGCDWTGEVGRAKQHTDSCLKRPWTCQYCDFVSTCDAEVDHLVNCTRYPTCCPNQCEAGALPRWDVEEHLTKCPLEVVNCVFADVGCNVKIARRDVSQHMEESQQQHLLSATLLNLRLTRETIAEKDRQLAEKDQQLAEKDKQVLELQKQLKLLQTSLDRVKVGVDHLLGGMKHCQEFTLDKVSQWKHWLSEPFYSHHNGYRLRLSVKKERPPSSYLFSSLTLLSNMTVGLALCKGECDHQLTWPVAFFVDVQLLDQLKEQKHCQQSHEYFFTKQVEHDEILSEQQYFASRSTLYPDGERSLYVVSDCIKLRLWINLK